MLAAMMMRAMLYAVGLVAGVSVAATAKSLAAGGLVVNHMQELNLEQVRRDADAGPHHSCGIAD